MNMEDMTPREKIARTAWGEARGLGITGMTATMNTMANRLASKRTWWGNSLESIATFGRHGIFQYSCWNLKDPNDQKLLNVTSDDVQYQQALVLADQLLAGTLPDVTNGADSYFDKRLPRWPVWYLGLSPCWTLGPHLYFNTVTRSLAAHAASIAQSPAQLPLPFDPDQPAQELDDGKTRFV